MELDFTKLNNITAPDKSQGGDEKAPEGYTEPLGSEPKEPSLKTEKAPEKANMASEEHSNGDLAGAKLDMVQEDHKRSLEVYKRFQKSTKVSYNIRTEILKGVQAGKNIEELFLKACEAIAVMTDDKNFFSQVEEDLKRERQTG